MLAWLGSNFCEFVQSLKNELKPSPDLVQICVSSRISEYFFFAIFDKSRSVSVIYDFCWPSILKNFCKIKFYFLHNWFINFFTFDRDRHKFLKFLQENVKTMIFRPQPYYFLKKLYMQYCSWLWTVDTRYNCRQSKFLMHTIPHNIRFWLLLSQTYHASYLLH